MTSRRAFLGAVASPLLLMGGNREWVQLTHAAPCMGTLFRVVAFTRDEDSGYRAIHRAFARAGELDAKLSDYKPESELSLLMREGFAKPFPVSDDLFRVLEKAQCLAEQTDGLFDVSIGPLSQLWRKYRDVKRLPDPEALREARAKVGYRHIHLNRKTRSIQLGKDGMQLDLGGIAKGYAADAMQALLADGGLRAAMVVSGGDIAVGVAPPEAAGWVVQVDPGEEFPGAKVSLSLRSQAVSTSGAHRQSVTIGSKTYSHIVDPRTGLGLTRQTAVAVIARTATESDALATAVSLMGTAEALAFLSRRRSVSGRVFLPPKGVGQNSEIRSTPGFASYLQRPARG